MLNLEQAVEALSGVATARTPYLASMTARDALDVWFQFAEIEFRVPPHPDADGLLYQFGVFGSSGERLFHFTLTRQFAVGNDEYLQVHLDLHFRVDEPLAKLGEHAEWWWRYNDSALTTWADRLRVREEWGVLAGRQPVRVQILAHET